MEDAGGRPLDRQELDRLLDFLLSFAEQTLGRHGGLHPFGAVLTQAGGLEAQAALVDGDEHPPPQPQIDMLRSGLRSLAVAGGIRCSGLCYDVRIERPELVKTDAIKVELEHRSGLAVVCYLPYAKRRFRGGYEFGELFAEGLEPQVFVVSESSGAGVRTDLGSVASPLPDGPEVIDGGLPRIRSTVIW